MPDTPKVEVYSQPMDSDSEAIQEGLISLYNLALSEGFSGQFIFASLSAGLGIIGGFQHAQAGVPVDVIHRVRDTNFDEGFKHGIKTSELMKKQEEKESEPEPEPTHPMHPTKQ